MAVLRALRGVIDAGAGVIRAVQSAVPAVVGLQGPRAGEAYETLWLELDLESTDCQGERAVLTRRQRVQFLTSAATLVRELVWGEGEQLVRYTARGARRTGTRAEGAKRAVLLLPAARPAVGDQLTITSRRTIRGGFRPVEEYCEAFLERPTGRLDLTVRFPRGRPPGAARLVLAATEQTLRRVVVRFGADGRAVLRCWLHTPLVGTAYSLRWTW